MDRSAITGICARDFGGRDYDYHLRFDFEYGESLQFLEFNYERVELHILLCLELLTKFWRPRL